MLTELSLRHYHEILLIPIHNRPANELTLWLRAKLRATRDILNARIRVDEASLKRRELDVLPELIKMMREARQENPHLH